LLRAESHDEESTDELGPEAHSGHGVSSIRLAARSRDFRNEGEKFLEQSNQDFTENPRLRHQSRVFY
jgi:hypothetical protein